jgi:hypothetical protein
MTDNTLDWLPPGDQSAATAIAYMDGWRDAFMQTQAVIAEMISRAATTEAGADFGPMRTIAVGQRIALLATSEQLHRIAAGHRPVNG